MKLLLKPSLKGFFVGFILIILGTLVYSFFFKYQISDAILCATGVAIVSQCIGIKSKHQEKLEKNGKKIFSCIQAAVFLIISIIIIAISIDFLDGEDNPFISYIAALDIRILVPMLFIVTITLASTAIKSLKKI